MQNNNMGHTNTMIDSEEGGNIWPKGISHHTWYSFCKPGMTQFVLLKHYRTQTNTWGIFCEVYGFGSRDHGFPYTCILVICIVFCSWTIHCCIK